MAQWLDPAAPTLARQLKAAGYATGHFGKWHMGGQRDVGDAPLITDYGFDKTLTTFEGLGDRVLPMLDAFDGKPAEEIRPRQRQARPRQHHLDRPLEGHHRLRRRGHRFHAARPSSDGKPFYVDVWPDDVHSPFFPPKALRGDGSKKELYLGVVQATDDQLAPLFDYVRNSPKLRDNTLIVDRQRQRPRARRRLGRPVPRAQGQPLRRRHPRAADRLGAGPARTSPPPARPTTTTVVAGMDFLPSILAVAGAKPAAGELMDGQDLSASLLGKEKAVRTKPLFWLRPPDRPGPPTTRSPTWPCATATGSCWSTKTAASRSSTIWRRTSARRTNLAAQKPEIVERLKKMVLDWRKSLPVEPLPVEAAGAAGRSQERSG